MTFESADQKVSVLTAHRREPSLFQANVVMLYRLGMSLGLASSHNPLRGLQFRIRSLGREAVSKCQDIIYLLTITSPVSYLSWLPTTTD